ncbi:class I SAM-dependent methyltransferase [Caenimonas sedimenti]|uniref:Class I SAM-dependent methyltransferase n=1 Tax=Caenimonas sedimenti TaxID=2596921 RepID=A0A562ZU21_9BURK|nr:methyltransferase domain-containing protein [Caenimonas sedimenti]TWO72102.1 class I SAM-dependent methyltransferase [Caenimonas sedimenti]
MADDHRLVAVCYIHQFEQERTLKACAEALGGPPAPERLRYFSSWGPLLDGTPAYKPCAHYLAPLDARYGRCIILRNAIPLPPSPALAAVLATMLVRMGEGSEILLELGRSLVPAEGWVDAAQLAQWLPGATLEKAPGGRRGWLRLGWAPAVAEDLAALRSTYPILLDRLPAFGEQLRRAGFPCADPLQDHGGSVENAFTYSMHWALHTRAVFDAQVRGASGGGPLVGMDVGGSHGFLACELAMQGHRVTDLELDAWKIEHILPWLAQQCGVADRVSGLAARMETLTGQDASYDYIAFMGSLLCIERKDVPLVLETAMRLLKPGGVLVIRENLALEANAAPGNLMNARFAPQEMHDAIRELGEAPLYFDHLGIQRSLQEYLKLWTAFAIVRKPGGVAHPPAERPGLLQRIGLAGRKAGA